MHRARVLLVECFGFATLFGLAAAPLFLAAAIPPQLASSLVLGATLVLLSAIDAKSYQLPDALTLPLIAAGLSVRGVISMADLPVHALAAALGFLSLTSIGTAYQWLRGRAGLGMGDAKLFAAGGAWVGPHGLPSIMLLACASALFWVAALSVLGRPVSLTSRIAFGPFLALAIWLTWLYGGLI